MVYPDIIVHRRGAGGPNLLVLEVKKKPRREPTLKDWGDDPKKLRGYKDRLKYKHAFLLAIDLKESNDYLQPIEQLDGPE